MNDDTDSELIDLENRLESAKTSIFKYFSIVLQIIIFFLMYDAYKIQNMYWNKVIF